MRWSVFIGATRKVSPLILVGPQFVGFAAVALFGGSPTHPPRARGQTHTALRRLAVAVYTIERMFDLGAAALIFSGCAPLCPRAACPTTKSSSTPGSSRWPERL